MLQHLSGVTVAIIVISHFAAFTTTVLRLIHRTRTQRLWWDDLWAFIALLFDVFYLVLSLALPMWVYNPHLSLRLFSKLGTLFAYTSALWASRISIAVTIVRLINPGKFRTAAQLFTVVCGMCWLLLVIQKIFPCGLQGQGLSWCAIPRVTGYIELGTDIVADSWLVLAPIYMLNIIKISRFHRRLVAGIFACSVLTIGACVAHIYFIVTASWKWTGLTAHIQTGVSITVCNMLVLATYVYRALFDVREHAAITTNYSTSEARPGQLVANGTNDGAEVEIVVPRSPSREGMTVLNLTDDLGSEFGSTGMSASGAYTGDYSQSEGLYSRESDSVGSSQPRTIAISSAP